MFAWNLQTIFLVELFPLFPIGKTGKVFGLRQRKILLTVRITSREWLNLHLNFVTSLYVLRWFWRTSEVISPNFHSIYGKIYFFCEILLFKSYIWWLWKKKLFILCSLEQKFWDNKFSMIFRLENHRFLPWTLQATQSKWSYL